MTAPAPGPESGLAGLSRRERVLLVLHDAGAAGVTVSELVRQTKVPPHDVKRMLAGLVKRNKATTIGARRRPARVVDAAAADGRLEEIYACRCLHVAGHRPVEEPYAFTPLTDETIERGHAGVAAARAALEAHTTGGRP